MKNLYTIPANRERDKVEEMRDLIFADIHQGIFLKQIYENLPLIKSAWPDLPDDIYDYWLGMICFHYYLNLISTISATKDRTVEGNCYQLNNFFQKKQATKNWLDQAIDHFERSLAIDPQIDEYKIFYILAINERNNHEDQFIRSRILERINNKELRWQIKIIIHQVKKKLLPNNYLVYSLKVVEPLITATN